MYVHIDMPEAPATPPEQKPNLRKKNMRDPCLPDLWDCSRLGSGPARHRSIENLKKGVASSLDALDLWPELNMQTQDSWQKRDGRNSDSYSFNRTHRHQQAIILMPPSGGGAL